MLETIEMRAVYCDCLIDLAEKDDRIVMLDADLMRASGTMPFKEKFPLRAIDVGVAEANMVGGVAAGLSAYGENSVSAFLYKFCYSALFRPNCRFGGLCPAKRQNNGKRSGYNSRVKWRHAHEF